MQRIVAGGFLFLAVLLVRTPALAEAFVDVYAGGAFTQSRRMTVDRFFAGELATRKVSYDGGLVAGVRGGMWFDSVGVALDFSYFRAAGDIAEVDVFSNSILLMVRAPLMTSDDYPDGQLQPYFMVGPGFFYADTHTDFRPDISRPVAAFSFDDVGVDLRAGLTWMLPNGIGVFSEYRMTWFQLHADDDPGDGFTGTEFIDTILTTHHIIAGISVRF